MFFSKAGKVLRKCLPAKGCVALYTCPESQDSSHKGVFEGFQSTLLFGFFFQSSGSLELYTDLLSILNFCDQVAFLILFSW